MTIPITLPIDQITHDAVARYAELHRVTFNQAANILLTIGLDTSLANRERIAGLHHTDGKAWRLNAAHNRAIVDQPFGP